MYQKPEDEKSKKKKQALLKEEAARRKNMQYTRENSPEQNGEDF